MAAQIRRLRDTQFALYRVSIVTDVLPGLLEHAQRLLTLGKKSLPRRGEAQLAGGADEQFGPQRLLDPLEGRAGGRGAHIQAGGGGGKV